MASLMRMTAVAVAVGRAARGRDVGTPRTMGRDDLVQRLVDSWWYNGGNKHIFCRDQVHRAMSRVPVCPSFLLLPLFWGGLELTRC